MHNDSCTDERLAKQAGRVTLVVVAIMLVHVALLAWGATQHSPVGDETGHLPAGLSIWQFGRTDVYRHNPPLVRLVASLPVHLAGAKTDWEHINDSPIRRPEFVTGRQFAIDNGYDTFWYFTLARWACIPFSLVGAFVCFRWARELYGTNAGLAALVLWCFSPNILGNAQTILPDTAATSLGLAAAYTFWRWLCRPTRGRMFIAGLLLAAALATKFTWVVLFLLWPVAWLLLRPMLRRNATAPFDRMRPAQMAAILAIGIVGINACYGFQGTLRQLGKYSFYSKTLSGQVYGIFSRARHGDNRFADTMMGQIPVPFPANYVSGIDLQKRDFELGFRAYLGGQWKHGGWWYYYLYGLAIKVPLGAWILLLVALSLSHRMAYSPERMSGELLLGLIAAVILVLVSSQTGVNLFLRYVLPVQPVLFIIASRVFSLNFSRHRRAWVTGCAALIWFVGASIFYFPHSASYFNELVGGPKGGPDHLLDGNIGWGQDLLHLKKWLDEHPEAEPLGLAYFGNVFPGIAGIEFTLPPRSPASANATGVLSPEESGPHPGWFAVDVNYVRGLNRPLYDETGKLNLPPTLSCDYTYFQHFEPVAMAGYSIYIYHITPGDAERELGHPQIVSLTTKLHSAQVHLVDR